MPLFAADALLRRLPDPVHVRLVRPAPPALREVLGPESLEPADALLRRLLADRRVEVAYGAPSSENQNTAATVRVGTSLATDRTRRPDSLLAGVVSAGEVRRGLATGLPESVVVIDCVDAAVALVRADRGPRDIHLSLSPAALLRPGVATALERLLDADVNTVVFPGLLPAGDNLAGDDPGAGCLARSRHALSELGEGFGSPAAPWLHIDTGWNPVEIVGRGAMEAVVLAQQDGPAALRTVAAGMLVLRAGCLRSTAVDHHPGWAGLAWDGVRNDAPAGPEYVAVETGSSRLDHATADRLAATIAHDLAARTASRTTPPAGPGPEGDGTVVPFPRAGRMRTTR
ncbi:hypothetical protein [Actinoplanes sp. NPDC026619]|uniref:hypothetical protein n=1 Tax=Actinoplanes sp. NPDC026619 TaxID=3155798 RepID=UPI0033DC9097